MTETKWTDAFLDEMRLTGDPIADRAAKLLWENKNNSEIIEDLKLISKNHNLDPKKYPRELIEYFQTTEIVEVTDKDLEYFKLSANIFNNYGYRFCGLLFFKALPTGYMCPKPGHVLESTKLLVNFAARRVMETAQFVFMVNTDDWYKPGNPGLEAIQKVRLMHAGMRIALLNDKRPGKDWKMIRGIPINQEDVALTNHLFSLAMVDGLDQMGIHLTQAEREAVFHTWQKIGQAMGICKELMVTDFKDGMEQYKKIFHRQSDVINHDGPKLTNALLESMKDLLKNKISLHSLEDLTNYFLDDPRTWKSLGLHKPSIWDNIFDKVVHFLTSLKIWQKLFNHDNSVIKGGFFTRFINYILSKRFNLEEHLSKYPKVSLLESVTKIILAELSKRDLQTFNDSSTLDHQKQFFLSSTLYNEWDLGSFELDVPVEEIEKK